MAKAATKTRNQAAQAPASPAAATLALNGETRGKFVLFGIPAAERVEDGPVMRGFVETAEGKINAAGWKKVGRESGTEYMSLKVGNTKPRAADANEDTPDEWAVGPFYGRLFKETTTVRDTAKVRYFGFIEDSVRVGEDAKTHKGVYRTNWQVQVKAAPDVSNDGMTHYISGTVIPAKAKPEVTDANLPF